jgi:CopG family nickel-responsive transcriptional regulator
MQRITITIDDDLMDELDQMIAAQGYQNRSEAIRDFTRAGMQQAAQKMGKSRNCMAALAYVYDHTARDLSRRLVENYHGHHHLSMATLHVHLDDDNCMEVTALKGTGAEVQHFADHIIAERGVRYGRLVMIPTEADKKADAPRKAGHHNPCTDGAEVRYERSNSIPDPVGRQLVLILPEDGERSRAQCINHHRGRPGDELGRRPSRRSRSSLEILFQHRASRSTMHGSDVRPRTRT